MLNIRVGTNRKSGSRNSGSALCGTGVLGDRMVGTDGMAVDMEEEAELDRLEGDRSAAVAPDRPTYDREHPLPEDVTVDELAARTKQPKGPRKASSQDTYNRTANKWWPLFLKSAGWCAIDKNIWLDADKKPRDGIFRQLFIWLYEHDGITANVFKTMLSWAQAGLARHLSAQLLDARPEYICNLPGVKDIYIVYYGTKRPQLVRTCHA